MNNLPLLSTTIFLPLLGCVFILLVRDDSAASANNVRSVAILTSLITLGLSIALLFGFDESDPNFQFEEIVEWIPQLNISYHVGIDGISLLFILLTALLTPIAMFSSWQPIVHRVKEFMILFLVMETLLIGMFASLDFVAFYLFFEGLLIPMFLIIGIWGGTRRVYAAYKFFLYTLLGSVLMLVAILTIYLKTGTTDIPTALTFTLAPELQKWLWLAFFASFAVKVPMWPFHTWLPDAHVEAPTAGSVILAGILLKIGGYGFIRFSLPMFPDANMYFANFVYTLSVIAIIYTSLVALAQTNMKKLIAYASIAHMGFVTLGAFTFNLQGLQGALFQMISHGLVSAALFLCVGVLYDREHSLKIDHYGGLAKKMPIYATVFMIFTLAAVALPGTSGFIGEILTIIAAYQVNWWWAAAASSGMFLAVAYMLWLYRRVMLGKLIRESLFQIKDLTVAEQLTFAPIIILVFLLGIYPTPVLKLSEAAATNILKSYNITRDMESK